MSKIAKQAPFFQIRQMRQRLRHSHSQIQAETEAEGAFLAGQQISEFERFSDQQNIKSHRKENETRCGCFEKRKEKGGRANQEGKQKINASEKRAKSSAWPGAFRRLVLNRMIKTKWLKCLFDMKQNCLWWIDWP
jgi:hypothetical protein